MEHPRFTAWITKYALSTGISEEAVEDCSDVELPDVAKVVGGDWSQYFHGEGKEWHRTRAGAVQRAEAMRVAKIASLKKKIAKLEKLRFS